MVALDRAMLASAFSPSLASKQSSRSLLLLLRKQQPLYAEPATPTPAADHVEEEVQKRLAKAREVLAKSKAKLEQNAIKAAEKKTTDDSSNDGPTPFFASKNKPSSEADASLRRDRVTKAKDEKTGLITADGEKMAARSEEEEWEFRTLLEVFENEMEENEDVYSEKSQQLAERDVAASIWNLRRKMKTEDYLKIFDKKNFFIGEDN